MVGTGHVYYVYLEIVVFLVCLTAPLLVAIFLVFCQNCGSVLNGRRLYLLAVMMLQVKEVEDDVHFLARWNRN